MRQSALLSLISSLLGAAACPGSPSTAHSSREMTVTFPETCDAVREEILARLRGQNKRKDSRNQGIYTLLDDTGSEIQGSHQTGDDKHTDLFDLTLKESVRGCVVKACSESQIINMGLINQLL